jgi:hypothetical protein
LGGALIEADGLELTAAVTFVFDGVASAADKGIIAATGCGDRANASADCCCCCMRLFACECGEAAASCFGALLGEVSGVLIAAVVVAHATLFAGGDNI